MSVVVGGVVVVLVVVGLSFVVVAVFVFVVACVRLLFGCYCL